MQHQPQNQNMGLGMAPAMYNNSLFQAGAPTQPYSFQNPSSFQASNPGMVPPGTLPSNDYTGMHMNGNGMAQHDMTSNQQFEAEFNPFNQAQPGKEGLGLNSHGLMVDPSLIAQDNSIDPLDMMGNLSSQDQISPTSGNMMMNGIGSAQGSPHIGQHQFLTPNHSRHTSLDPASAGTRQGPTNEWSGHRRSPSEQSEGSVGHSPFQGSQENFDPLETSHSPMLNPSNEPVLYGENIDLTRFNISEQQQRQSLSRGTSPYSVSPQMVPSQGGEMPQNNGNNHFVLPSNAAPQFDANGQMQMFPDGDGSYLHNDMGQADMMVPPEINVDSTFAPPSRVPQPSDMDPNAEALSPPNRGTYTLTHPDAPCSQNVFLDFDLPPFLFPGPLNILTEQTLTSSSSSPGRTIRNRAQSDTSLGPHPMARPLSPAELSPQMMSMPHSSQAPASSGMSFDPATGQMYRPRSLSPFDATFPGHYRSSSPGSKSSRRSSTSSINPNRDYILELADPSRPTASGPGTRVQKHPATFQCTKCPKRFTRAYNLRSHLRTHTDERPFVCSVCGKAFARQHDRKRHEGLHSGEKKFVCRGELANAAGQWGCGRRFARADALGRHFRSEAGRVCIKPLLDEEAAERQRVFEREMMAQGHGQVPHGMMPAQAVLPSQGVGVDMGGGAGAGAAFALPQALLVQYPALQGLQWDQLGQGGQMDEDEAAGVGGPRSSFDANGNEYYEDEEGYVSGPGTAYANQGGAWVSDYEGR